MGLVSFYPKLTKGVMPILMRGRKFLQIAELDWTAIPESPLFEIELVLFCGLAFRLSEVFGFLVKRSG